MDVGVDETGQDPLAIEVEDTAVEIGRSVVEHGGDAFPLDPQGPALDRLRLRVDQTCVGEEETV
ncbi:MAG: hypothetical protein BRD51_02490 [Bacteroidetes bacterium SW_11_64_17]|nr:MAG: hypothetical protein BRD51_02490 [Bacteroidetes bacterium SW_11_64_17]